MSSSVLRVRHRIRLAAGIVQRGRVEKGRIGRGEGRDEMGEDIGRRECLCEMRREHVGGMGHKGDQMGPNHRRRLDEEGHLSTGRASATPPSLHAILWMERRAPAADDRRTRDILPAERFHSWIAASVAEYPLLLLHIRRRGRHFRRGRGIYGGVLIRWVEREVRVR
jgi:hypothetical protein